MRHWSPPLECSETEKRLLKVAGRSRKLFVFLREHRHELFDDAFQEELESMYRQTGQARRRASPRSCAWRCCCRLLKNAERHVVFEQAQRSERLAWLSFPSTKMRQWPFILMT